LKNEQGELTISKSLRRNERIRVSPIRLIDQDDEQLGIVEVADALARARDAGLDLVEVAPQSRPPVCRIMDYGKFMYAQQKKERQSRAQRHESELKEIRIRTPKIGDHDLMIKVNRAHEFLARGDRVQFSLRFRSRELAHIDIGIEVFKRIKESLSDIVKIERDVRREGRRITMLLAPAPGKAAAKQPEKPKAAATAEPKAAPKAKAPENAPPAAPPAQAAESTPPAETGNDTAPPAPESSPPVETTESAPPTGE